MFQQKVATRPSALTPSVSSAVASRRTRARPLGDRAAVSPVAVAVTIACARRTARPGGRRAAGRAAGPASVRASGASWPALCPRPVSWVTATLPAGPPGWPRPVGRRTRGRYALGSVGMPTEQAAAVCLDVGSTWTKAVLVRPDGTLAGFAEHPTTVGGRARRDGRGGAGGRGGRPRSAPAGQPELLACSSAGRRAAAGGGRHRAADQHRGRRTGWPARPGRGWCTCTPARWSPPTCGCCAAHGPGVVLLIGGADGDDPAAAAAQRRPAGPGPHPLPDRAGRQRGGPRGRAGAAPVHRAHRGGLRQRRPAAR